MSRAISLIRVSTLIQTEEMGGTGVQFQTEKLSQYATLNNLNLIKTITDVCSGALYLHISFLFHQYNFLRMHTITGFIIDTRFK